MSQPERTQRQFAGGSGFDVLGERDADKLGKKEEASRSGRHGCSRVWLVGRCILH